MIRRRRRREQQTRQDGDFYGARARGLHSSVGRSGGSALPCLQLLATPFVSKSVFEFGPGIPRDTAWPSPFPCFHPLGAFSVAGSIPRVRKCRSCRGNGCPVRHGPRSASRIRNSEENVCFPLRGTLVHTFYPDRAVSKRIMCANIHSFVRMQSRWREIITPETSKLQSQQVERNKPS